jgi:hypothetical protein
MKIMSDGDRIFSITNGSSKQLATKNIWSPFFMVEGDWKFLVTNYLTIQLSIESFGCQLIDYIVDDWKFQLPHA